MYSLGCLSVVSVAAARGEDPFRLDLFTPSAASARSFERDASRGAPIELIDETMTLSLFEPADDASGAPAPPASGESKEDLAKKLQNPIADLISVPFQFNWDSGYAGDADRYTLNIQPVIPFSISKDWNVISRTIVPVIYQDSRGSGSNSEFGIGDTTQSFFFSPKEPVHNWIVGFGPVLLLPTGTDSDFRTQQLGFGPTVVALRQRDGWTYGALANHIWGVTGSDDRPDLNSTFLQPLLAYTWPSATTLTLNSETSYNWTSEEWTVPINLMLSQLVKIGEHPVQFQIGGRYYVESPSGGPDWGLRFTVTFLFPK